MERQAALVVVVRDPPRGKYVSDVASIPTQPSPIAWCVRPQQLPAKEIHQRYFYIACKRVFDVVGAVVLGLTFAPIIVFVTFALARSGSIVFSHERLGKDGKLFKVYKFRSMVPDAERVLTELLISDSSARAEWAADRKLKDDPRITSVGAFLRKSSLDELPQLINVLKGEMSLVGPRPIVPAELEKYGRAARYYLAVKPGLTGLWQVTGRNDVDYRRRIALDRRYARKASFWLDITVLAKTVMVVLARRGAY